MCQVADRKANSSTVESRSAGAINMPGLRLLNAASFDADTTRAMGLAYEEACASLDSTDAATREAAAKRIIEAARRARHSETCRVCDRRAQTLARHRGHRLGSRRTRQFPHPGLPPALFSFQEGGPAARRAAAACSQRPPVSCTWQTGVAFLRSLLHANVLS